jgi:hypothetical protein
MKVLARSVRFRSMPLLSISFRAGSRWCLTFVAGIRRMNRMHLRYFSMVCWLAHQELHGKSRTVC